MFLWTCTSCHSHTMSTRTVFRHRFGHGFVPQSHTDSTSVALHQVMNSFQLISIHKLQYKRQFSRPYRWGTVGRTNASQGCVIVLLFTSTKPCFLCVHYTECISRMFVVCRSAHMSRVSSWCKYWKLYQVSKGALLANIDFWKSRWDAKSDPWTLNNAPKSTPKWPPESCTLIT